MSNFSKVLGFFSCHWRTCASVSVCVYVHVCVVCGCLPNTCVHVLVFRVSARVCYVCLTFECVRTCIVCCAHWRSRVSGGMCVMVSSCVVCVPTLLGCVFVSVYMFLCVCVCINEDQELDKLSLDPCSQATSSSEPRGSSVLPSPSPSSARTLGHRGAGVPCPPQRFPSLCCVSTSLSAPDPPSNCHFSRVTFVLGLRALRVRGWV